MTQGQTLIGVLVAAVTLTLLVVGIVSAAVATTRLLTDSERHTVALGIVNERIEFLRSVPYEDIGFLNAAGSLVPGVLAQPVQTVVYNGQEYQLATTVAYADDPLTAEADDYKEVSVVVSWTAPSGTSRDAGATIYAAPETRPLWCGGDSSDDICTSLMTARTCDQTIGFCLPDVPAAPLVPAEDCEPGLLCDDAEGSLCGLDGTCGDEALELPSEGDACTPGQRCPNSAICPLSGVCPVETCPRGQCESGGACFSGYCYDLDWYETSFPPGDASGPGASQPMQCEDVLGDDTGLCETSADCPATCSSGGVHLVWQCERTWVPDCRFGTGGAAGACAGGYGGGSCGDLECLPQPCPVPGGDPGGASYCPANQEECGLTSSHDACSTDAECPAGEVCNGSNCRTICPDQPECRLFWGGYVRGCKAYPVAGAVDTILPTCEETGALENPALPQITATIVGPGELIEETGGGTVSADFTVSLSQVPDARVTVRVVWGDNEAARDDDYFAEDTTVTFESGVSSQTIPVQVSRDSTEEENESFFARIADARSNAYDVLGVDTQETVTIINDDVSISIADAPDVAEGNGLPPNQAVFTVTRLGSTSGSSDGVLLPPTTVVATVITGDGSSPTAEAGADYDPILPNTVTVMFVPDAGLAATQEVLVDILGDAEFEEDEHFNLIATDVSPASVAVTDNIGVATILDDDYIVDVVVINPSFTEGDPLLPETTGVRSESAFRFDMRGRAATHDVDVAVYTQNGTAAAGSDYVAIGTPADPVVITIPSGQTSWDVSITIVTDHVNEPLAETFSLVIADVVGASAGVTSATVQITDDDVLPVMAIDDVSLIEGNSGVKTASFRITLSEPYLGGPVMVNGNTIDGTALVSDNDYLAVSRVLTFTSGETERFFDVGVIGDTKYEPFPDEYFVVQLSDPINAVFGQSLGVGTIVNDDSSGGPSPSGSPAP
jgi:hypothetical protein